MNVFKFLYRLDFHKQCIVDYQVCPVGAFYKLTAIQKGHRHLPKHLVPSPKLAHFLRPISPV